MWKIISSWWYLFQTPCDKLSSTVDNSPTPSLDTNDEVINLLHDDDKCGPSVDVSFNIDVDLESRIEVVHEDANVFDRGHDTEFDSVTPGRSNSALMVTPPHTNQYRHSKRRRRTLHKITEVLLSNATDNDSSDILKNFNYMNYFSKQTMIYFKNIARNARVGHTKKVEAATLLHKMFEDKLYEHDFQIWLMNQFCMDNLEKLNLFLAYKDNTQQHKINFKINQDIRQQTYNYWINNSELSVARSNNRHIVNIATHRLLPCQTHLEDENITENEKKAEKVKAHQRITVLPYRRLHEIYRKINNISFASFIRLKPFYISPATVREMEVCLCGIYLNAHILYNAVRKNLDDTNDVFQLSFSLSVYACKNFNCEKVTSIDYHDYDCVHEKCENGCKVDDCSELLKGINDNKVSDKKITYYAFETETETYFNVKGKKVTYTRTAWKDKKEKLSEIICKLRDSLKYYVIHRFCISNDKYYWKYFVEHSKFYTLWIDYSVNIALKEKKQAQSAHYSGKQSTLHNTVMQPPMGGEIRYIYHLSDDTNHNSILTFTIIEDISKHPEVVVEQKIVLRSVTAHLNTNANTLSRK